MGVGGQRHALADFRPRERPVPTAQEVGWAIQTVWTGVENLTPTVIRSLDLPTRDESLHQLSYTGPHKKSKVKAKFRTGLPVPKISVMVLIAIYHWLLLNFHTTTAADGPTITFRYTQTNTHTHTLGGTRLDEWLVRHRDLYLTTHNTQNRQKFMLPAGFKPAIPASGRQQTHAIDRAAIGKGITQWYRM